MRTRKRTLYVATESTYGADPDTDGSDYSQVPAITIGDLKDGKEQLATDYFTGRAHGRTAPVTGRDGWSFDVTVPLIGLSAAAGDGGAPPANDWLDIFLTHIFGTQYQITGEGISAAGSTTTLTLDTDQATLTLQSPIAIGLASVPSGAPRLQMGVITVDSVLDRTYTPASTGVTDSAIVFGSNTYRPDDDGGASLAFVYRMDGLAYTLLGGRCTAASIKMESPGKIVTMSMSFAGDTKTYADLVSAGQKQTLDMAVAMATTPIKGLLSPMCFGTTYYTISSFDFDFGIAATEIGSTAAVNGRAGYESVSMAPTLKCTPLYTDALLNLKRDITAGRLLLQLGAGLSNHPTVQNAIGIFAEQAVATVADHTDDNGVVRQGMEFKLCDAVNFDASTASQFFQMSRF